MEQNKHIVIVQEDENGDCYIELGYDILDRLDWKIGDSLKWVDNHDGSWSIIKVEDNENE